MAWAYEATKDRPSRQMWGTGSKMACAMRPAPTARRSDPGSIRPAEVTQFLVDRLKRDPESNQIRGCHFLGSSKFTAIRRLAAN